MSGQVEDALLGRRAESLFGEALSPGARLTGMLALGLAYAVISCVTVSGSIGFMFAWLGNFKLLAYSANRGPLAHPGLSPGQWLLMLLLPYFPAKRGHRRARAGGVLLALVSNIALGLALTAFLTSPAGSYSSVLRHTGYALYVYVAASLLLDCAMPLGCAALNHMDLQPSMDNPFISTSVREFWGRRYNQIVSAILQDTVYLPIVEGRWVAEPQQLQFSPQLGAKKPRISDGSEDSSGTEHLSAAATGFGSGSGSSVRRRASAAAAGNHVHHVDSTASTAEVAASAVSLTARAATASGLDGVDSSASLAALGQQQAAASGGQHGFEGAQASPGSGQRRRRVACSRTRQIVAMWASFAVSGVMHEVCIAFMCGGRLEGSYHMLAFFLLQPLIILAQGAATAALLPPHLLTPQEEAAVLASGGSSSSSKGRDCSTDTGNGAGKWTLARRAVTVLRVLVTAVLVVASADALFWGPFETCRIDERGLQEVLAGVENVKRWVAAAQAWYSGAMAGL